MELNFSQKLLSEPIGLKVGVEIFHVGCVTGIISSWTRNPDGVPIAYTIKTKVGPWVVPWTSIAHIEELKNDSQELHVL